MIKPLFLTLVVFWSLIASLSSSFLRKLTSTIPIAKGIIVRIFWLKKDNNDNFALYSQPPSCILFQLLADAWDVAYPRLCIPLLFLIQAPFHQKKKKKKKSNW